MLLEKKQAYSLLCETLGFYCLNEIMHRFNRFYPGRENESCPITPIVLLIRKIIAVLEGAEKFPQYFYETPGSAHGLQVVF